MILNTSTTPEQRQIEWLHEFQPLDLCVRSKSDVGIYYAICVVKEKEDTAAHKKCKLAGFQYLW